jgi:HSP20 family protein
MNIVKWNPMRDMELFTNGMSTLFGNHFLAPGFRDASGMAEWQPVVDIFDKEDQIVIKAELPGVDKKDICVDVKDGILTLSGERTYENEVTEGSYYRKERAFGKFNRSFALPEGLDPEKIDADFKDGVLNIEIPKPEEKKPRKVAVH